MKFWTVSGADPTSTAGQPAYTVRVAPKDDGGLLGAAKLAWDAVTGVPLRAAVYAQGASDPVLELEATDISYGAVSDDAVRTTVPAGAKVVTLDSKASERHSGEPKKRAHGGDAPATTSVTALAKQLDFELAAPDKLAGLPRRGAYRVDFDGAKGALVMYGKGLGGILVFQHKTDAKAAPRAKAGSGHRARGLPAAARSTSTARPGRSSPRRWAPSSSSSAAASPTWSPARCRRWRPRTRRETCDEARGGSGRATDPGARARQALRPDHRGRPRRPDGQPR